MWFFIWILTQKTVFCVFNQKIPSNNWALPGTQQGLLPCHGVPPFLSAEASFPLSLAESQEKWSCWNNSSEMPNNGDWMKSFWWSHQALFLTSQTYMLLCSLRCNWICIHVYQVLQCNKHQAHSYLVHPFLLATGSCISLWDHSLVTNYVSA